MLTGGGDCPGLNAVIRAIVRKGERTTATSSSASSTPGTACERRDDAADHRVDARHAARGAAPCSAPSGGSPFDTPTGVDEVEATIADLGIDALIVIGGNGSLSVACKLLQEHGLPIVGVPKTIDNDIVGTDVTFGFHTAVQIATDAIDRLHTTAESHDRVMVVEVMGRHSGWIATYAGIAGGADGRADPEIPFDIEEVCQRIIRRHERGRWPRSSSSPRAPSRVPGTLDIGERCTTSSATCASAGSPTSSPGRSASAPGSRPASSCSVTSSAVARRRRSTGSCPPASASPPSTSCTTHGWGQMVVARGRTSCPRRWSSPSARPAPSTSAVPRRRRGLLRLRRRRGRAGAGVVGQATRRCLDGVEV